MIPFGGFGFKRDPAVAGGFSIPVAQELLEDAAAIERGMIRGSNPMMSEARLQYWMDRGGWSAFALFKMRIYLTERSLDRDLSEEAGE